jgi:outer membrane immunogenic protein
VPPGSNGAYDWTGFYVGGHGGFGFGKSTNGYTSEQQAINGPIQTGDTVRLNNVIGGGQIGVNRQTGMVVVGLEADADLGNQRVSGSLQNVNSSTLNCPFGPFDPCITVPLNLTRAYTERLEWFTTERGRIGVALGGWLIYGTGGFAYGQIDTIVSLTQNGGATATYSTTQGHWGWAAGAGIETALTANLTFRLEYLYLDLGNMTSFTNLLGFGLTTTNRITDNLIRGGFNYRF